MKPLQTFAIALATLVVIIVCVRTGCCAAPPTPEPPKTTTEDPLRTIIWNEALNSGTNIRYWSALADSAASKEWWYGLFAIVAGVFSFAFPLVVAPNIKMKKLRWLSVGVPELVSAIAFVFLVLSVIDTSAHYKDLASIHSRWAVLKPELDELFAVCDTLKHDELQLRYDALKKAKQGIVPTEPAGKDDNLMHEAWKQEMHARNQDAWVVTVEANKNKAQSN